MVNTPAICAAGPEFKFRDGQVLQSVANGSPPFQHHM